MCLFPTCARRDVSMKCILLTVALLTAQLACGAGADCYSTNGTSLRESFRDDNIVMMGRVASVVQESSITRRIGIEHTQVLKGSPSEFTELVLQDFRQIETNVPEPIVGAEFLFTLRRVGNEQPGVPPRYMTINMDPQSSKVWDPLELDASCTDWRELMDQWTTELSTALGLLPEYTAAWITVLSERTGLSEAELATLLVDVDAEILQWRHGFYFRSQYSVMIDWLVTPQTRDQFTIFAYRPRDSLGPNKWATIDEIRNMRSPGVQPRIPTQIAFRSEDELNELVLSVTGKRDLVLTYDFKRTLRAWSVFGVDVAANMCRIFEVDLESGDTKLRNTACRVTIR